MRENLILLQSTRNDTHYVFGKCQNENIAHVCFKQLKNRYIPF